jgi:putative heme-binding domain-containing protein
MNTHNCRSVVVFAVAALAAIPMPRLSAADSGVPGFEFCVSRAWDFGFAIVTPAKGDEAKSLKEATAASQKLTSVRTVADEAALLSSGRMRAQQHALLRLGAQADSKADEILLEQFDRLDAGQLPFVLWLELFEAAAQRNNPALKARLAKRAQIAKDSPDPLAAFRECLEGGDAEAGRQIFMKKAEAGCIRCHSVDGQGGQIGPDLTWLRHSVERLRLLEDIIEPNATLAPGYAPAILTLNGGEEVSGVVTNETGSDLTMTSVVDGRQRHIAPADVTHRTPLPSPMPPIFGVALTKREIRDLIEFLAEGD